MALNGGDVFDANESGADLTVTDVAGGMYGSATPWDSPAGSISQIDTSTVNPNPNAGPVATYPGQGGVQIGGGLTIGLPGGGGVQIGGTSGPVPYPGAAPGVPYRSGVSAAFGGTGLLWLIVIVALLYIFFK